MNIIHTHHQSINVNYYTLSFSSPLSAIRVKELMALFIEGLASENFSFLEQSKRIQAHTFLRSYYTHSSIDLRSLIISCIEDQFNNNLFYLCFCNNVFFANYQLVNTSSLFSGIFSLIDSSLGPIEQIEIQYCPFEFKQDSIREPLKIYIERLLKDNSTQLDNIAIHRPECIDNNRFYLNFYNSRKEPILENLTHALVFFKEFKKQEAYFELFDTFDKSFNVISEYTQTLVKSSFRRRFLNVFLEPDSYDLYRVFRFEIHITLPNSIDMKDSVIFHLDVRAPERSTVSVGDTKLLTRLSENPRENAVIILNLFKEEFEKRIGPINGKLSTSHLDLLDMNNF